MFPRAIHKTLTLTLAALLLPVPGFSAPPQTLRERKAAMKPALAPKLAPDLEELLAQDDEAGKKPAATRTLAQKREQRLAKRQQVAGVTLPSTEVAADEPQSFIVQMNDTASGAAMQARLASVGGRVSRRAEQSGLVVIEAPRSAIRQLAADSAVAYISPDRPVIASGHVGATTGWLNTGIADNGDSDPNTWLTGDLGHIAVIDSGMDTGHSLMRWMNDQGQSKVDYSKDFTGQGITGDPYGHGTHVTTMFAGDWVTGNSAYEGLADGASIINLRVLDSNGAGAASNVIAALDWCVTNKTAWDIRVINLSLGTIAKDSYKTDPLCLAARRAWNAGIVVVCAAGNDGKDSSGRKIYGAIHSPGNDPAVITVGAANTMGTNTRSDDTVASFSSRGPTRSYAVVNGVRKYDNLIKPDLIAPGNKLIGARSSYNGTPNKLVSTYPNLKTGTDPNAANQVMYMSGTSMSAPIVAGAAALLIQVNPNLTPNLIKAILMYTAQPIAGFNTFEQGAGELNVDGAVRLARLVKATLPTTSGTALLTAALPTSQTSTIAGQNIKWSQGVVTNFGFLYGSELMTKWQSVYGSGVMLADATAVTSGVFSRVSGKTTAGVSLKNGAVSISSSGVMLADGVVMADGVMLADGVVLADGVMLADGVVLADGVMLADGTTRADLTLKSASGVAVLGDNTACMPPAP
ncbi:MAG: S8 family peptidase [Blastocatellia bacterium]